MSSFSSHRNDQDRSLDLVVCEPAALRMLLCSGVRFGHKIHRMSDYEMRTKKEDCEERRINNVRAWGIDRERKEEYGNKKTTRRRRRIGREQRGE